jgi:hypothetical protein
LPDLPNPLDVLLLTGHRHTVTAATADEAFLTFQHHAPTPIDAPAFHQAVAAAVAAGLIREPVRLPQGSLQCHWRLELTPAGVARARALIGT